MYYRAEDGFIHFLSECTGRARTDRRAGPAALQRRRGRVQRRDGGRLGADGAGQLGVDNSAAGFVDISSGGGSYIAMSFSNTSAVTGGNTNSAAGFVDMCGPGGHGPGAVPEPASIVLLGTGTVALIGYGWRRRKRAAA
jgi:hypothetical protein